MTTKFLLHSNSFSERGDSVTLISLASAMRERLGINAVIAFPSSAPQVSEERLAETTLLGIPVFRYRGKVDLDEFAVASGITHTYVFSSGRKEDLPYYDPRDPESFRVGNSKHITHVVFRNYSPHGEVYAYVSDWLYDWSKPWRHVDKLRGNPRDSVGKGFTLVTSFPHFLERWPENTDPRSMRKALGIPEESFVIGRIGGQSEFSDKSARKALFEVVTSNDGIHAILVNTNWNWDHPRVHCLPELSRQKVREFYDSCDLLINGRKMGESFGYSIVEPLSLGKPVIGPDWTRNPLMDRHHIRILRPLGLLYSSAPHLERIVDKVMREAPDQAQLRNHVASFGSEKAMATLSWLISATTY